MIATEESMKASRDWEVVMDDLGDTIQGLEYSLAKDLLPLLVDTMQTLLGTYDAAEHAEDGISGLDKAFGGLNAGISGLKQGANILAFIGALIGAMYSRGGLSPEKVRELQQAFFGVKDAIDATAGATKGATAATEEATKAAINYQNVIGGPYREALENARDRLAEIKNTSEHAALAIEASNRQMDRLNEYINGTLGPNEEKFTETQGDLNTKMGEIQGEIDQAIRDGYDPLGEKVLDLKGQYADLKKQYDENAKAHEEDTKRIILGILAQQMAAMGFSDSTAFAKIALKWGLIDEATMNAMMATDKAINWLRNHPGDYAGFEAMMNGVVTDVGGVTTAADTAAGALDKIVGQHEVGIHVTVTGDAIPNIPVWKPGEPYIGAATGFEGIVRKPTLFMAGEAGYEYVNIMPAMKMKLRGLDIFGGAGMTMADHKNQLQPAAAPIYITIQGTPEKEMEKRRQARYVAEEIQRRQS
jgi:hypothetical protein